MTKQELIEKLERLVKIARRNVDYNEALHYETVASFDKGQLWAYADILDDLRRLEVG
ncbi:MAG TPA: hypothetical protein HA367_01300 [Candidatus Methanofastidiosum sp.]|nr:hypothetical protein [Methanofastidiosum sp.]